MSTKLYNGLRLTAHAPDIYQLTREIARVIKPIFKELATKIIAEYVAQVIDYPERRPEGAVTVYDAAKKNWLNEQLRMNPHLVGQDPLHFRVAFAEVGDAQGTRRLAYAICEQSKYRHALLAMATTEGKPYFTDYHFQTSTDRPDEISEEEWEQRRRDWDRVLDDGGLSCNGAFDHLPGWQLPDTVREVFGTWTFWNKELDLNAHVSRQQRLHDLIESAMTKQIVLEDDEFIEMGDRPDFGVISRHMQIMRRVIERERCLLEHPATPLPQALPTAIHSTRLTDLTPYEVPESIINRVTEAYFAEKQH